MNIRGYDQWKTAYPPEWDDPDLCEKCESHEVEFYDANLCGDCYYEQHHGELIDTLTKAIDHVQKHFEQHNKHDYENAMQLIARAQIKLEEIPE